MEDHNIIQPKIEKQERVCEISESMLQASVEKLRAGYKRIDDAKRQRTIQVLQVNNLKSHSNTGYKNHGKSSQERVGKKSHSNTRYNQGKSSQERVGKLHQLKINRKPKFIRDFY
ncbi:hypothetical protein MKX03_017422 [Papaver bracteatum]|nr:hypothetical protein MKX03_017422 [Papaver bracteatum]